MRIAEEQLYRLTNPNVEKPAILDYGNQFELLKTIALDLKRRLDYLVNTRGFEEFRI